MKPQRFERGQEVTRVIDRAAKVHHCIRGKEPKIGPIYHVDEYENGENVIEGCTGYWYISVKECPGVFGREDAFEPIELSSEALTALLEETQTITQ